MIRALLSLRLRALFAGLTRQGRQKKKQGKGTAILFGILYLYIGVVVAGLMCLTFGQLAPVYHALGLDWLYFAIAGTVALALSLFGTVFTTQSQLYSAKDNEQLLSMPIPPRLILLSRMMPLLGMNLLFCGLVMIPASVMWAILVEFYFGQFLCQLLMLLCICFLVQAIACLLGWGLHWLLQRIHKSLASLLYMTVFLAVYFAAYSQMGSIMTALTANGTAIAAGMRSRFWPLYALGMGGTGNISHLLAFLAISAAAFAAVYAVLSATFLRTATSRPAGKRKKLDIGRIQAGNSSQAIIRKEWRHFLGSPVYLTNMGIGILMTAALAVAGVVFRGKLLNALQLYAAAGLDLTAYFPLLICGILSFLVATSVVSAPSVSLEGKHLWILKSLPVSGKEILTAKLRFHLRLTTPVTALAGLVLGLAYGCGAASVLCALVPGLLTLLCGLLGLICGLQWAKLDWLSEAYPCKQGAPVGISMFAMMGVPLVLAVIYFLLAAWVSPALFLLLCAAVLILVNFGLYKALLSWGVRKWEAL